MSFINLRYDNKILILWGLFLIQLFLIGALWILQGSNSDDNIQNDIGEDYSVNFVRTSGGKFQNSDTNVDLVDVRRRKIKVESISNFSSDFIVFTRSKLICFREGTHLRSLDDTSSTYEDESFCRCHSEWHGKDCGQPEILWRAFMTSKVPLSISEPRTEPRKVFYMITGNIISLEMLEIQIMELKDSVDYYIICNENKLNSNSKTKRLKLNFANTFVDRIFIIEMENCTAKFIYRSLKEKLDSSSLNPNDIFVLSQEDEILNHKAIKYLKYYDNFSGVIRFRLKYNVYGFFMQHPESTKIGSAACTINYLEDMCKGDPSALLRTRKPSVIIGDLNHFGGWYCEYCYQPSEIIDRLHAKSLDGIFPNSLKNRQIDVAYIQNLIAAGLYVDGKVGLIKLHRYTDKYFTPEYVDQNSWRFDNILVNLYLTFEDDYEN